jgi:NADH:ubiquinone oxidoreductase subunit C
MNSNKLQDIAARTSAVVATDRKSTYLTVSPEHLKEACQLVVAELPGFYHLSTITGVDDGKTIGIFYHFWKGKEFLSVKTSVPKDNPVVGSLIDVFPASLLYESEVKDILGITFQGNPMMGRKLLLPDNYPPDAPPPLRKEADPEKIRKMMELE